MAVPFVIATNGIGIPVTEAPNSMPYEIATNGYGTPVVFVPSGGAPVTGVYDPDASALFARFTTPPTNTRRVQINTVITSLKTSGVWQKLDALYVTAAADSQAARQNWIGNVGNLTEVSSPAFVADRGYTGDGVASCLTGIDFASLTKWVQDSNSIGVWIGTEVSLDGQVDIAFMANNTGRVTLQSRTSTGNQFFQANTNTGSNSVAVATSIGMNGYTRRSASNVHSIKNAVAGGIITQASTGVPSGALQVMRGQGSAYSTRRTQAQFVGAQLSDAEVSSLYNALNAYMSAVGAV